MEVPNSIAAKPKVSIRSLQIFEAVARTGSTVRAAEELSVTQSAISHQLKHLSQVLGEKLFEKSGRTLKLTERGSSLARELTQAFLNIGESLDAIIGSNRDRVRIVVSSSFGTGRLVPNLAGFTARLPDITLDIFQSNNEPDPADAGADVVVTASHVSPGFEAVDLVPENLIAVAAPRLRLNQPAPAPTAFISTSIADQSRGDDWSGFTALNGVRQEAWHNGRWIFCSHHSMALAVAEAGEGIALVPDYLAARALQQGRLEQVSPLGQRTGRTYRLCIKSGRMREPALLALKTWFEGCVTNSHLLAAAQ